MPSVKLAPISRDVHGNLENENEEARSVRKERRCCKRVDNSGKTDDIEMMKNTGAA